MCLKIQYKKFQNLHMPIFWQHVFNSNWFLKIDFVKKLDPKCIHIVMSLSK